VALLIERHHQGKEAHAMNPQQIIELAIAVLQILSALLSR
jgi:hypothetical protein